MNKYFLYDHTANTGKHYINNDSDQNQEGKDNAVSFKTRKEGEKYIKENMIELWAIIVKS